MEKSAPSTEPEIIPPARKKPEFPPEHRNYAGKKPGTQNKTTRILKEAILLAAEAVGEDGKGARGLMGFLIAQAKKKDNGPFMTLLGKVLPMTVVGDPDKPVKHVVTVEVVEPDGRKYDPTTMPPRRPATAGQLKGAAAVSTMKHPVPLPRMNGEFRKAARAVMREDEADHRR